MLWQHWWPPHFLQTSEKNGNLLEMAFIAARSPMRLVHGSHQKSVKHWQMTTSHSQTCQQKFSFSCKSESEQPLRAMPWKWQVGGPWTVMETGWGGRTPHRGALLGPQCQLHQATSTAKACQPKCAKLAEGNLLPTEPCSSLFLSA